MSDGETKAPRESQRPTVAGPGSLGSRTGVLLCHPPHPPTLWPGLPGWRWGWALGERVHSHSGAKPSYSSRWVSVGNPLSLLGSS